MCTVLAWTYYHALAVASGNGADRVVQLLELTSTLLDLTSILLNFTSILLMVFKICDREKDNIGSLLVVSEHNANSSTLTVLHNLSELLKI